VVALGPPYGFGDRTNRAEHVGSAAMTAALERGQPQLMVCGHTHEAPAFETVRLELTPAGRHALHIGLRARAIRPRTRF
jgi:Icc-related predicted phosphoesterase